MNLRISVHSQEGLNEAMRRRIWHGLNCSDGVRVEVCRWHTEEEVEESGGLQSSTWSYTYTEKDILAGRFPTADDMTAYISVGGVVLWQIYG